MHYHAAHVLPVECEVERMSSSVCPEMGQFRRMCFCDLKPHILSRSIFMYIHVYVSRLTAFANRLLRNTFESEREEVTGQRTVHS